MPISLLSPDLLSLGPQTAVSNSRELRLGPVPVGRRGLLSKATGDDDSLISRSNSAAESGLFSGEDAKIIAVAFRMALRKPSFGNDGPEESPEEEDRKEAELLYKELAEEGGDIRSVSRPRGVKVKGPLE